MSRIQVFDPPMCCSTGVCGPTVDPALPKFAADLAWLQSQGMAVERFNLAQQSQAFASSELVRRELTEHGNSCLPLIVVDGATVSRGEYPSRQELAVWAGVTMSLPVAASVEPGCCGTTGSGSGATNRCC